MRDFTFKNRLSEKQISFSTYRQTGEQNKHGGHGNASLRLLLILLLTLKEHEAFPFLNTPILRRGCSCGLLSGQTMVKKSSTNRDTAFTNIGCRKSMHQSK